MKYELADILVWLKLMCEEREFVRLSEARFVRLYAAADPWIKQRLRNMLQETRNHEGVAGRTVAEDTDEPLR